MMRKYWEALLGADDDRFEPRHEDRRDELEAENRRLRKLVANQALIIAVLRIIATRNV
jgi:hypothetical protein